MIMPIKGLLSINDHTIEKISAIYGEGIDKKIPYYKDIPYICDLTGQEFITQWHVLRMGLFKTRSIYQTLAFKNKIRQTLLDNKDKIINLFRSGKTFHEIAKKFGVMSDTTISIFLDRLGIHHRELRRIWTNEEVELLKQLYSTTSTDICAKKLNKSKLEVNRKAARLKIKKWKPPEGYKQCNHCEKIKHRFEFAKASGGRLAHNCLECSRHVARKKYRTRKADKKNGFKFCTWQLIAGAKNRAKIKNLEFDLDLEWLRKTIGTHCPATGVKFNFERMMGKRQPNSPSIDRIENSKGYLKSNCIIVAEKVNRIKTDACVDELIKVAKFYESLREESTVGYQI